MQTSLVEPMATECCCLAHFWDGVEEALPPDNIYISDTDLKQKLISYSQLADSERTKRKNQLIEIVCQKLNLANTKALLREVIDSV